MEEASTYGAYLVSRPAISKRVESKREWMKLEECLLLPALFLLSTGGAFLTPEALTHAEVGASMVATPDSLSPLHTIELALATLATLPIILSRWRSVLNTALNMKLFTASALLAIASTVWSQDPAISLRSSVYLLSNTLLAFALISRFRFGELMRLIMRLGVMAAAISILMAAVLPHYAWTTTGTSHVALQGAFMAKNVLGTVFVLLLTPAFFARGISPFRRAIYIATLLLLILLSFSVQAWLGAILCPLFWCGAVMYRRLRTRDFLLILLAASLVITLCLALLGVYSTEILLFFGKDPTLTGRTIIWKAVLHSILKRPFVGWGYNAFWRGLKGESAFIILSSHWAVAQSQSSILEVLLSVGGVGLLLVLGTFVQAIRNATVCLRSGSYDAGMWYLAIVLVTIFYSVGEAVFDVQNSLAWIMYMLACTGLAVEVRSIRQRVTARSGLSLVRPARQ